MSIRLRGLAWDHRRCWGPLEAQRDVDAVSGAVTVDWTRQSLLSFGEGQIEEAVRAFDLVIYDHPFIGEIARQDLMVPLEKHLSAAEIEAFAQDSVGKSFRSYEFDSHLWALPIDTAAQVASCRPDLLEMFGGVMPNSHAQTVALAKEARKAGKYVALPYVPTDAGCLIITFSTLAGGVIGAGGKFVARSALEQAVGELRELAAVVHPSSRDWNPIRCYDHMVATDEVIYTPFAFGYVNYATPTPGRPTLRFGNIPRDPPAGAILGGAGIGVSRFSQHKDEAIAYSKQLCAQNYQKTFYVKHGGQPGSRAAWTDAAVNAATGNFFADTLATLDQSYLRPTHPGFIGFFREITFRAFEAIEGRLSVSDFGNWLDEGYARTLHNAAKAKSKS